MTTRQQNREERWQAERDAERREDREWQLERLRGILAEAEGVRIALGLPDDIPTFQTVLLAMTLDEERVEISRWSSSR